MVVLALAGLIPLSSGLAVPNDPAPVFLFEWGQTGELAGELDRPRNLEVDRVLDRVYVANEENQRIEVFDKEGNFLLGWGGAGSATGEFNEPSDVAVNSQHEVLVADSGNDRIQVFDTQGSFLDTFGAMGGAEGQFDNPTGVAVDDSGNVYVSEINNDRVQVFDASGNFVRMWGAGVQDGTNELQVCTTGCQSGIQSGVDGGFSNPRDLTVGERVYVSDTNGARVQIFEKDGTLVSAFGSFGSDDGELNIAEGIEFFRDRVYVADRGNERIQVFDADGNFVTSWGIQGTNEGEFDGPTGVSVDDDGKVFVVDTLRDRVLVFGPLLEFFIGDASGPGAPGRLTSP